jgi:hypothetical protein
MRRSSERIPGECELEADSCQLVATAQGNEIYSRAIESLKMQEYMETVESRQWS